MKRARLVLAVAGVVSSLGVAATVNGSSGPQPTGWDGVNPFVCELQNAGTGTTIAHPAADPLCVQYDKRHQNVDQLGVVDFLSKEPARFALAGDKCFYFQSDHWRSSVVQSNGATKIYEWDGHYFFNKATGEGGAWVTNFNINGQTGDPTTFPGFPSDWSRYFGPGTGGVIIHNHVPADPGCAARAQSNPSSIYASPNGARGRASPFGRRGSAPAFACATPTGGVDAHHVGPVALGDSERHVRDLLGTPAAVRKGFLHYCQRGAGRYLVGFLSARAAKAGATPGTGSNAPVAMILTTNPGYALNGIRRGSAASALRARFPNAHSVLRQRRTRVWTVTPGAGLIAGVRMGRVRYLAVYDRRAIRTRGALARILRRAVRKGL
jgi:hypothetical protein